MQLSRTASAIAALAATAVALTGCGSDDADADNAGDAAPAGAAASLEAAEDVVRAYLAKGFSGDVAACEHESEAYTAERNELQGAASCEEGVEAVRAMMVDDRPLIDVDAADVTMRADGEAAITVVRAEAEGLGAAYRLVLEGETWMIDGEVPTTGGHSTTWETVERMTRLELATSTLGRSRSTN